MSCVCLIIPTTPADPSPEPAIPAYRSALERAGYEVSVLVVFGPGSSVEPGFAMPSLTILDPGRAAAAVGGLNGIDGDYYLVLDLTRGYLPEDLPPVMAPLVAGEAEMALAARPSGAVRSSISRKLVGTTDPFSGLIGMTRAARDAASAAFGAAGAHFSWELLGKVSGRRVDVPIRRIAETGRPRPTIDDVRQLKRLADHRFGNASRLIQFCVVGASGMVVDLTCYYFFQKLLVGTWLDSILLRPTKVPLSLALAASGAIGLALIWNFSLNRRLTFSYARVGSLPKQFAAYVASNLLGLMVSLALRLLLPRKIQFFNDHKLLAAVVGIVLATGISFSMSRWVVFRKHKANPSTEADVAPAPIVEDFHASHVAVVAE